MARHRSHSVAFKRQVAGEFVAGETLHALAKRYDISRQLIRIWTAKFEAGTFDEDAQAADLIQEYEAKIAALERMVGRQALKLELLKGALKHAPRPRSVTVALGRKNWLFAGSDAGGERAATIYSLIQTAKLNGLDPEAYPRQILGYIADHPVNRAAELLPWNSDASPNTAAETVKQ